MRALRSLLSVTGSVPPFQLARLLLQLPHTPALALTNLFFPSDPPMISRPWKIYFLTLTVPVDEYGHGAYRTGIHVRMSIFSILQIATWMRLGYFALVVYAVRRIWVLFSTKTYEYTGR